MKRKLTPLFIGLCSLALSGAVAAASESFDEKQARLDKACQDAREAKLKPEREKYVEECVEKGHRDSREACERFYADHGNQSGNRAPLYMDLPECVEAFEHERSKNKR